MSRLRIRHEVFSHGVLSVDLLHLHEQNLTVLAQQLSLSALSHSSGNTAALTFTGWCHQAQELFRSTEIVARLYFETFLTVHNKNIHRHGAPKLLLSADLGEFLLYLHLQKFRTHCQQPSTNQSSPSNRSNPHSPHNVSHQPTPLEFILSNLPLILLLIRDPHKHLHDIPTPASPRSAQSPLTPPISPAHSQANQTQSTSHLYIEPHEFNRLSFLFYAHDTTIEHAEHLELVTENQELLPPEQRNEVMNLSVVTPFFEQSNGHAVPISVIQEWLITHFTENQSNPSDLYKRPTFSHGHLSYPPSVKRSHISNIRDSHLTFHESDIQGGDLLISSCSDCCINVLTHSRYAIIEDVHNSVIQCGTVGSLLIVRRCSSLTLTVATRVIHFAESRHLRVYLFSAMRPVVLGTANADICLAPYNTYYPDLTFDLTATAVPCSTNCWSSPVVISHASGSSSTQLLHSPLRGSRGLNTNLSIINQSPPPPSSPRRSSSPSPLLSPLSHNAAPPVSSPTSPFKRTHNFPGSPSSAGNSISPADRSPNGSTISPVPDRRRSSRARGKSTGAIKDVRPAHRMSDEDDSGSEYSTDDERIAHADASASSRQHVRIGSPSHHFSTITSPQHTASHGLKFHHSTFSSNQSFVSGLSSPEDRSSGHTSPANTSPPFGPSVSPQSALSVGVNSLSTSSPSSTHLSPSVNYHSLPHALSPSSNNGTSFFSSSPSNSAVVTGVVSLLSPDLFFPVSPPDTEFSGTDNDSVAATNPSSDARHTMSDRVIGATANNPFALPSLYSDFLHDRALRAGRMRELISSTQLDEDEQRTLLTTMKQSFQSWLKNAVPQTRLYLKCNAHSPDLDIQTALPMHNTLANEEMTPVREV